MEFSGVCSLVVWATAGESVRRRNTNLHSWKKNLVRIFYKWKLLVNLRESCSAAPTVFHLLVKTWEQQLHRLSAEPRLTPQDPLPFVPSVMTSMLISHVHPETERVCCHTYRHVRCSRWSASAPVFTEVNKRLVHGPLRGRRSIESFATFCKSNLFCFYPLLLNCCSETRRCELQSVWALMEFIEVTS